MKFRERLLAWIAYETFSRNEYLLEEPKLADLIEVYLSTVPRIEANVDGLSVLKTIEAQHGLLVERAQGVYSFSHLTLQEYFTASYVKDNADEALPYLLKHVGEDPWREVFLLTAGMLFKADIFASQYLEALARLASIDEMLSPYLQWGAEKSANVRSGVWPVAARAFFFFLVHTLVRALGLAHGHTPDYTRVRTPPLDPTLDLAHALDPALDPARAFASSFIHSFDRTLALIFALDLAITYDLGLLVKLSGSEDARILHQLNAWGTHHQENLPNWLQESLAQIAAWEERVDQKELSVFSHPLEELLKRYWGLEQFWEFSEEQVDLLNRFIAGTQVLVECLEVASISDREAIKAQLLLPPRVKT